MAGIAEMHFTHRVGGQFYRRGQAGASAGYRRAAIGPGRDGFGGSLLFLALLGAMAARAGGRFGSPSRG